jgi:hypothetical protein
MAMATDRERRRVLRLRIDNSHFSGRISLGLPPSHPDGNPNTL